MRRGRRTWSGWRGSCQPWRRRQRGHVTAAVVLSPAQRIVDERFDPSALVCSARVKRRGVLAE
jgi:hypothetical protein